MHQRRPDDALSLESGQQIRQKVFDTAGERWIVLTDVQDAHGSRI
jgi:hypothetical protein